MANPLTAGTWQVSAQAKVAGAKIAAQGTTALASIPSPVADAVATASQTLTYGTGSGEADVLCGAAFALLAGATLTLDILTGTDFKNVLGGTAAVVKLKGLFVGIPAGGGGDSAGVVIGSTASGDNALTLWFGTKLMTWTVKPSGAPMLGGDPAGVTVDATHKNLVVTNAGAVAVTVVIALAGTSV